MDIANTLEKYLVQHDITYDKLPHRYTVTSMNTALVANIPVYELAKSVVLEDDDGYIMAVVPATRHVKIRELNRLLNRKIGLATEAELQELFKDCDLGAIPPVGEAYGMKTIVDEAGNHEELIHVNADEFRKLMQNTQHADICMH